MLLLHLCEMMSFTNRPSAPQSIKAVVSSVLSKVSTDMGKVNRRLEMDHTVTCEISRSSIVSFGRGSASTVSCPTVKNPVRGRQACPCVDL